MSETTSEPAGLKPALFAALAAVQAEYPKIAKGKTANTGTYSYDYADLAAISEVVLPLIGKHGLAFTAKPTRDERGDFVLAYSLVHKSGEREDGDYPLPSNGTAQTIGSAITYARRYSLCAVTGIAPGGEDDDGAAASQQPMQTSRPRQQPRPQAAPEPASALAEPDEKLMADWGAKIDGITSRDEGLAADAELVEIFKTGRMDSTTANAVRGAIKAKVTSLKPAGPKPVPPEPDTETEDLAKRAVAAQDLTELTAVWADIRKAQRVASRSSQVGEDVTLGQYVQARKTELEAAGHQMAGASR
jgi:hypothetical protein